MGRRRGNLKQSEDAPSQPSPNPPSRFTFVNQSDDLQAVATKRLKNEKQRHQIRSHVMRGVRQNELALGKKRPTGREHLTAARKDSTSEESASQATSIFSSDRRKSTVSMSTVDSPLHLSPVSSQYVDPFNTLPRTSLSSASVDALLKYCFTILMPMTFPVESKQITEVLARRTLVLQSKIERPATFFGFLATIAAHRAILYGNHKELGPSADHRDELITCPDYRCAKQEAIMATRAKVNRGEVSDGDFLEACFGLISTASVVGNFAEAITHLQGAQKVLEKVGIPEAAATWLPLADLKAAGGLLTKPIVRLPWTRTDVPEEILSRILPPMSSPLSRLGSGFLHVQSLSSHLQALILKARFVCYLCEFNAANREGLSSPEQTIFRCKTHELEHDLLSYVYDVFPHQDEKPDTLVMPAIEMVVRTAIMGILTSVAAHVLPACGIGRAITHHQKNAVDRWFREAPPQPPLADLKVIIWALFIFIRCAEDQPEVVGFERALYCTLMRVWLMNWEEVETTMYDFLYIPHVQRPGWMKAWDEIQRFNG